MDMHSAAVLAPRRSACVRPRLLFISTRYLFPADSGGKIRTVNILRGLQGGAFEVHLASPVPEGRAHATELRSICDRFLGWPVASRRFGFALTRMRHLASTLPIAVATDYSSSGRHAVREEIGRTPDLIVVDFPHAAVLAPPPYPCASVLFTHNVEAEIFRRHAEAASDRLRRAIWRNQARKMESYERTLLPRFDAVVAVAERDREYFRTAYGATNVMVIPTGVDLDYFSYTETPPLASPRAGTVVFTGSMDWMANIDGIQYFMDEVWPAVTRVRPEAKFVVVGKNPPPALVERAKMRRLNWTFSGFVDDVRPFVRESHAYVIPLRVGGGTRIKVYEAMAMGCAVVSTRIGVEGLPVEHERHFVEADAPADMAAELVRLLDDHDKRLRLSRAARSFVESQMSTQRVAQIFEDICKQAVQSKVKQ